VYIISHTGDKTISVSKSLNGTTDGSGH